MNEFGWLPLPEIGSTSTPLDLREGTGDGSLVAIMISMGFPVSRYTPEGSIIPFGQDIGTAADASALTSPSDDRNTAVLNGSGTDRR